MARLVSLLRGIALWRWLITSFAALTLFSPAVHAALPAVTSSGGGAATDYMVQMRDYVGLAIGLIALVLSGYAFIAVSGGAIAKFNEWRAGKAELGDLKMVFIVGGLLLLVVIYLVTQAVGVIASSGTFAGGG